MICKLSILWKFLVALRTAWVWFKPPLVKTSEIRIHLQLNHLYIAIMFTLSIFCFSTKIIRQKILIWPCISFQFICNVHAKWWFGSYFHVLTSLNSPTHDWGCIISGMLDNGRPGCQVRNLFSKLMPMHCVPHIFTIAKQPF